MKLEISKHLFEKSSNIKFHETPSSGKRTARHVEANSRFSLLCERDSKYKLTIFVAAKQTRGSRLFFVPTKLVVTEMPQRHP
jgi:hypothetical protein